MISVVMPAYNASKTIRASIESVRMQTVEDWELIVIDDGSTDDTTLVISDLVCKDRRIRFFQNHKNMGVSYSRNRAIDIAVGEWIAFLDSDDLWKPEKLEKQLALICDRPNAIICYTASDFIDEDGRTYKYIMEAAEHTTHKMLLKKNLISCSSVMIRTEVMKNVIMPSDDMHEDYYVWLTVLKSSQIAYGINEPLLTYRLSRRSKSANRFKSAMMLFCTYRAVGYSFVKSCLLTCRYAFHSISKRRKIYNSIIT